MKKKNNSSAFLISYFVYLYNNKSKHMKNKRKIKCTKLIPNGIPVQIFCNKFLLLRKIRNVGDEEVINNFVLSKCKSAKEQGTFDFIIIE